MWAFAVPALADPTTSVIVGDGLAIKIEGHGDVMVSNAGHGARLASRAESLENLKVDRMAKRVELDVDRGPGCLGEHLSFGFAQLQARIENTDAYARHRKHDWAGAIAGYAKAIALDPTWRIPAYNRAGASVSSGDLAAGVAALAPWLASEPIATFVQVSSDPELAPLLARPELAAIRAAKPGTVTLIPSRTNDVIGVAAERGLVAVSRIEAPMGCQFDSYIELHDVATNKRVASMLRFSRKRTRRIAPTSRAPRIRRTRARGPRSPRAPRSCRRCSTRSASVR